MYSRLLRSRIILPPLLILAAIGYWWLHPRASRSIGVGYVGDRNLTLWNTLAQVRQPVADLHYGDRVEVMRQEGIAAQVRTSTGAVGWVPDSHQLLDAVLWQRSADLLASARKMPVQARGHTKAVSNVRIEPGRNAMRIFQFSRGVPVVVLERSVADTAEPSEQSPSGEKGADDDARKSKQEDWLLVMRADGVTPNGSTTSLQANSTPYDNPASADPVSSRPSPSESGNADADSPAIAIAGWVLARFIEADLPGPVRDYANSANLHVVAWFELNRVPDGSGGEAPQYLVAGSSGAEGQLCDFTMLRVYTWGAKRMRYETAYVESDLCGRFPIRVSQSSAGPQFRFAVAGGGAAERAYVMQQTSVRRVREGTPRASQHRR